MNNTIILNHYGLFIYVDIGHPEFYHDVTFEHLLKLAQVLHSSTYDYLKYLLGNPRCMGEGMFIVYKIGQWDLAPNMARMQCECSTKCI